MKVGKLVAGLAVSCVGVAAATASASASGTVDRSFGRNGVVSMAAEFAGGQYTSTGTPVVAPDGQVNFLRVGPGNVWVSRFGRNGPLAANFGFSHWDYPAGFSAMTFDKQGRALLLGGSEQEPTVTRLLPDGALDASFGNAGSAGFRCACNGERTVSVDSAERVIVRILDASIFNFADPAASQQVDAITARFGSDGKLDSGFGAGGVAIATGSAGETVPKYSGRTSLERPNGSRLIAGFSADGSGSERLYVRRIAARGLFDGHFSRLARRSISRLHYFDHPDAFPSVGAIVPRPDGAFDLLGASDKKGFAVRFQANGAIDRGFGRAGVRTIRWPVWQAAFDPNGRAFAVGSAGQSDAGTVGFWLNRKDHVIESFGNGGGAYLTRWDRPQTLAVVMQGWRPIAFAPGATGCRSYCPPEPKMIRFAGPRGR
jgi:hypothetical protein